MLTNFLRGGGYWTRWRDRFLSERCVDNNWWWQQQGGLRLIHAHDVQYWSHNIQALCWCQTNDKVRQFRLPLKSSLINRLRSQCQQMAIKCSFSQSIRLFLSWEVRKSLCNNEHFTLSLNYLLCTAKTVSAPNSKLEQCIVCIFLQLDNNSIVTVTCASKWRITRLVCLPHRRKRNLLKKTCAHNKSKTVLECVLSCLILHNCGLTILVLKKHLIWFWFDLIHGPQLIQKWRRPVFVQKLVDKLLHSIVLFLTQNFNYNFIFFAKNHCLLLFTQQRQVSAVNAAGTRE